MIVILNPQGLRSAGPWMLPREFAETNYFTLASPSSQQILESRGLLGYGRTRPSIPGLGAKLQCQQGPGGRFVCDIHQRGMSGYGASVRTSGPPNTRLPWSRFQGNVPV